MPRYQVTSPDGKKWEVTAPEGATQDQVIEYAKQQWQMQQEPAPQTAPAQPPQGDSVGRQVGLFARSGIKGLAGLVSPITDTIGGGANAILNGLGDTRTPRFQQLVPTVDNLLTKAGLPAPASATERMVGQGVEMGAGALGMVRGAQSVANKAAPMLSDAMSRLAAQPTAQVVGAAAGGAAGQHSKDNGDGWLGQLVSTVAGSLLGGGAVMGVKSAADAVKRAHRLDLSPQVIEQRITIALQDNGIDPATISPAMRTALTREVSAALRNGGELSPDAVARLADYTRVGATPTQGRLSLDPLQITMEMNAAKKAAALGATDARLPQLQNENNRRLIEQIDAFNPIPDRLSVGQAATAPITRQDAALSAAENALYGRAREMAGGSIPLERGPFLQAINDGLERSMKAPFLPAEVKTILNRFSTDPSVPFTVESIDQLKTILATAQRSTQDGNVRSALRAVRDALDNTPLNPMKRDFGGGQVVTQQTAGRMTQADRAASDLMEQLNAARQAAFQRRSWQQSSPLIENTLDGADPARFVESIVSRSTSAADAARAAGAINADPVARGAVRSGIAQVLKDASIGKGNQSATGNFSGRGLLSALDNIGDAKLRLFFDADEIEMMRAAARVGTTETFQPRGSAVNNSNTAAGIANLLDGLSQYIVPKARNVPFGEAAISTPLMSLSTGAAERNALNTPQGLLSIRPGPRGSLIDPLMLPMVPLAGGLLSAQ